MATSPATSSSSSFVKDLSCVPFKDRAEAGRILAQTFMECGSFRDPLVLALPRGGVPVASEMAKALHMPLDVYLVRRFNLPGEPEILGGLVASGGVHHLYRKTSSTQAVKLAIEQEYAHLVRRERSYRQSRKPEPIAGRTVIVVDDGLTTGTTMRSAILALRLLQPAWIISAVPVASPEVCAELATQADSVVCARKPHSFFSVRRCYTDFSPVLDSDIRNLLSGAGSALMSRTFHA